MIVAAQDASILRFVPTESTLGQGIAEGYDNGHKKMRIIGATKADDYQGLRHIKKAPSSCELGAFD